MNEYCIRIKDIPIEERPRERLIKYGESALSNAELLAIILRTGTKSESALDLAKKILSMYGGITFLANSSVFELSKIRGIGFAKACQIKACIELGKRLNSFKGQEKVKITCPEDVALLVMDEMRFLTKEHFRVIFLNTKNYVIQVKDISIGSLNSSIVHPREVFLEAIKQSSASIILCHNHPSGDPNPSSEDINITKRLIDAGKILGIEVLDHLIIGDGKYISLKEKNII
ncbi:RadC family protein [Thermobrachium celere]|uniref:DNA repair protein RadC n=1 Tax=Thermobrachium celere DSM 8682 TaxID=941824 RepID=R7RPL9_9CLOT|nr:DNA repair protein RadC [Thermobrachium celere]CDF58127.1 DNA repair protein RadC [Thermobrachium celere DSM 8682]